jgi:hypothetical protein
MMWSIRYEEGIMELSLRLDLLGMVEVRYLRTRERYRDWPPFLLFAASRQARILAYLNKEAAEQLHQQILVVEEASGLGLDDGEDDELDDENDLEESNETGTSSRKELESETAPLSPAFAQALERLNELARQRLPDGGSNIQQNSEELDLGVELEGEEDALEQLQDAFVQMMDVVRELAEELSTDALKLTGRFRCVRTDIYFTQAEPESDGEDTPARGSDGGDSMVELDLILRLFEDGRNKPDDLPAVELRLDVDDFERLHETLDVALERERRSRRKR